MYSGFGNSWDWKTYDTSWEHEYSLSYIPIKFGVDIKYLWDFLERGKHTLGLNVGLGYQFDLYVNGKKSEKDIDSNHSQDPQISSKNYNAIFSNNIYPIVGLHYYYGHHQFEVLYRFGGIIDSKTKKTIFEETDNKIDISLTSASYLTFNYAYRF